MIPSKPREVQFQFSSFKITFKHTQSLFLTLSYCTCRRVMYSRSSTGGVVGKMGVAEFTRCNGASTNKNNNNNDSVHSNL